MPWAWDGLVFAVPLHETTRYGTRDIVAGVNGAPATESGTSSFNEWVHDGSGNSALHLGGLDYLQYADSPVHDKPSTEITVHLRMRFYTGAQDAWGCYFCNPYQDLVDPFLTWALQDSGAGVRQVHGVLGIGGVYQVTADTAALTTGEYLNYFLRWRSGETPRLDVYGERGLVVASVTDSAPRAGSLSYNAGQGVRLNAGENPAGNGNCLFSQAMVWRRKLADAEVAQLNADPFGWYAPRRETVTLGGQFPIITVPAVVVTVGAPAAAVVPNLAPNGAVESYDVTAGPNADATFTHVYLGARTDTNIPAGTTVNIPINAASAGDVTFAGLDTPDSGV